MKLKRRIYYSIIVDNASFCNIKKRWVFDTEENGLYDTGTYNFSNCQDVKYMKKAFKISDKLPIGTIIQRLKITNKGHYVIMEWEKTK